MVFADSGRLIAVRNGDDPNLPEVRVPGAYFPEIEVLVREVRRSLGLETAVLRCVDQGDPAEERPRVYSMVSGSPVEALDNDFRWAESAPTDARSGSESDQAGLIRSEFVRVQGGAPHSPVVPWEWPHGWHDAVGGWIADGVRAVVPTDRFTMEPVRTWSISTVYRIRMNEDAEISRLYFKASPSFFSSEVDVTSVVAGRFPEISPRLVAFDSQRRWMLMDDLGDRTFNSDVTPELWQEAMRSLARIQLSFVDRPNDLSRLRLERRTVETTGKTLRSWIDDPAGLNLYYSDERGRSALDRLAPHISLVDELCHRIDAIGLPDSLDHGDLDSTNIFVRNGVPVIMDWSDACISNPVFTPALISQVARNPRLSDAFLAEWTDYATLDSLRENFEYAKPVAALARAFHYHRNIVPFLNFPSADLRALETYIPDLLNLAASGLERISTCGRAQVPC